MADERWLTVEEIVDLLKVHEQTVRRWLRAGELRGVLLGRKAGYRIRERDLEAFLAERDTGELGKAVA
jgi:excisionase family DNA binding protein